MWRPIPNSRGLVRLPPYPGWFPTLRSSAPTPRQVAAAAPTQTAAPTQLKQASAPAADNAETETAPAVSSEVQDNQENNETNAENPDPQDLSDLTAHAGPAAAEVQSRRLKDVPASEFPDEALDDARAAEPTPRPLTQGKSQAVDVLPQYMKSEPANAPEPAVAPAAESAAAETAPVIGGIEKKENTKDAEKLCSEGPSGLTAEAAPSQQVQSRQSRRLKDVPASEFPDEAPDAARAAEPTQRALTQGKNHAVDAPYQCVESEPAFAPEPEAASPALSSPACGAELTDDELLELLLRDAGEPAVETAAGEAGCQGVADSKVAMANIMPSNVTPSHPKEQRLPASAVYQAAVAAWSLQFTAGPKVGSRNNVVMQLSAAPSGDRDLHTSQAGTCKLPPQIKLEPPGPNTATYSPRTPKTCASMQSSNWLTQPSSAPSQVAQTTLDGKLLEESAAQASPVVEGAAGVAAEKHALPVADVADAKEASSATTSSSGCHAACPGFTEQGLKLFKELFPGPDVKVPVETAAGKGGSQGDSKARASDVRLHRLQEQQLGPKTPSLSPPAPTSRQIDPVTQRSSEPSRLAQATSADKEEADPEPSPALEAAAGVASLAMGEEAPPVVDGADAEGGEDDSRSGVEAEARRLRKLGMLFAMAPDSQERAKKAFADADELQPSYDAHVMACPGSEETARYMDAQQSVRRAVEAMQATHPAQADLIQAHMRTAGRARSSPGVWDAEKEYACKAAEVNLGYVIRLEEQRMRNRDRHHAMLVSALDGRQDLLLKHASFGRSALRSYLGNFDGVQLDSDAAIAASRETGAGGNTLQAMHRHAGASS